MDEKERNVYLIKDEDRGYTILVTLTVEQADAIDSFISWAEMEDFCSIKKMDNVHIW